MLTEKDLKQVSGGFNWSIGIAIGGFLTLLAGIIDGYLRPLKCNS